MSELFLADENFPVATVRFLRERGDDVIHALETFSGVADDVLLAFARAESRIILTFDLDFGNLVFRDRLASSPGVVLFRVEQFDLPNRYLSPSSALLFRQRLSQA